MLLGIYAVIGSLDMGEGGICLWGIIGFWIWIWLWPGSFLMELQRQDGVQGLKLVEYVFPFQCSHMERIE